MSKMRRWCLYVTQELGHLIDELAAEEGTKLAEFIETLLRKSPKISRAAKKQGIEWPKRIKAGRPWPKKPAIPEDENSVN